MDLWEICTPERQNANPSPFLQRGIGAERRDCIQSWKSTWKCATSLVLQRPFNSRENMEISQKHWHERASAERLLLQRTHVMPVDAETEPLGCTRARAHTQTRLNLILKNCWTTVILQAIFSSSSHPLPGGFTKQGQSAGSRRSKQDLTPQRSHALHFYCWPAAPRKILCIHIKGRQFSMTFVTITSWSICPLFIYLFIYFSSSSWGVGRSCWIHSLQWNLLLHATDQRNLGWPRSFFNFVRAAVSNIVTSQILWFIMDGGFAAFLSRPHCV